MGKVNVYVSLDGKELERTKKDMIERAKADAGDADQKKDDLRVGDYETDLSIEDSDGLFLMLSLPIGYFSFSIDSIQDLLSTAKIIKKKADELHNAWLTENKNDC